MKLEVAVEDVSQCVKGLTIEVAAEDVKAEFNKTYEAYQRHVKLPGFRPGRVPRDVVKQRFGKEIKEEVLKQILPHAFQHAVKDKMLQIIGEPAVTDYTVNEGEPLKFKISVEVLPDFELKQYKGLKATKRVVAVSDEDVEKTLESWRESAAELVPVEDRPSQIGDVVSVNVVGKYIEPVEEEDLKADNLQIELGAEGTHEAFNENLMGVKPGDVREFRVVYPEDFTSKGLAGKTLDFTATVTAVRQKELPELDDDFAKGFAEVETVDQLRERIREDHIRQRVQSAESKVQNDLIDQIVETYDFDVPPSMVEKFAEDRTRQFADLLLQSGISREAIQNWDWENHLNEMRSRVVRDVRASLIASKISQAEDLKITQAEMDAEIARIADSTGRPFVEVKARLTKEEALSSIENRLLYMKALEVIVKNAEINVEEVSSEQEAERMKAEAAVES